MHAASLTPTQKHLYCQRRDSAQQTAEPGPVFGAAANAWALAKVRQKAACATCGAPFLDILGLGAAREAAPADQLR